MSNSTELILEDIMELIERYGSIDGAHHKQWLLDQIVRLITKTDDGYNEWRKKWIDYEFIDNGDDEEPDLEEWDNWDEGIAP